MSETDQAASAIDWSRDLHVLEDAGIAVVNVPGVTLASGIAADGPSQTVNLESTLDALRPVIGGRFDAVQAAVAQAANPGEIIEVLSGNEATRRRFRREATRSVLYGLLVSSLAFASIIGLSQATFDATTQLADDAYADARLAEEPELRGQVPRQRATRLPQLIGMVVCGLGFAVFGGAVLACLLSRRGIPFRWWGPVRRLHASLAWSDSRVILKGLMDAKVPFPNAARLTGAAVGRPADASLEISAAAAERGELPADCLARAANMPMVLPLIAASADGRLGRSLGVVADAGLETSRAGLDLTTTEMMLRGLVIASVGIVVVAFGAAVFVPLIQTYLFLGEAVG